MPSGDREAHVYAGPVNYRDPVTGKYQPIDATLVDGSAQGYAFTNRANSYSLLLPRDLSTPVKVAQGDQWVSFALRGATGSLTVKGAVATYVSALPGVDVSYSAGNGGANEDMTLANAAAPSTLSFSVQTSAGLSLRANKTGGIDLTDGEGVSIAVLAAPTVVDAAGAKGPITMSLDGDTVTMTVDPQWLSADGRAFPVTIDPTVAFSGSTGVTDCTLKESAPNVSNCAATTNDVGYNGTNRTRSILQFPTLQATIPLDSVVLTGTLQAYVTAKTSTSLVQIDARRITRKSWTSSATWNKYDGSHLWTTAGGDFDAPAQYSGVGYSATGIGGATGVNVTWTMTELVQDWVNGWDVGGSGTFVDENGVLLKQQNENVNQVISFASTEYTIDTTKIPSLTVRYNLHEGLQASQKYQKYTLDDRMSAAVNVADGQLVVANNDIHIPGVGLDLSVGRFYNSNGSAGGQGWSFSGAPDVKVEKLADGSLIFNGPSGYQVPYVKTDNTPTFTTPPGENVVMKLLGNGDYQLTKNKTSEVYEFKNEDTGTNFYNLITDTDRNGNQISLSYVSGTQQLNQITDTHGVTVSATYTSGNLTKLQDSTGRQWKYHYNTAGLIDTYTDPETNVTTYVYDTSNLLKEIDTPEGRVTKFGTNAAGRIATVKQIYDNSNVATTTLTTQFAYHPGSVSACTVFSTIFATGCTVITDPKNGDTQEYFDPWDRVSGVVDARSKMQAGSYSANNDAIDYTDALSDNTVFSYSTEGNNNLTQLQSPSSNGTNSSAITSFSYGDSNGNNKYLPTGRTDPQGNCIQYVYDHTHGNLTDVYAGLTSSTCTTMGGAHYTNSLDGIGTGTCTNAVTGELCTTTDPNSNIVTYSYDTSHRISRIAWPSPQGHWDYTYDSLSRIATFTDGRGQTSTYTYDKLDRATQVLFNGATTCTSGSSTCIKYTLDKDGNLKKRVDDYGTVTYDYDDMGRLTRETLPSSSDACAADTGTPKGTTYSYDDNNNLATACNALGTTGYAYNATNQLASMYEPGGNCGGTPSHCTTFTVDDTGRRTGITYPVTNGASETNTYNNAGQHLLTTNTVNGATSTAFLYSYTVGTQDTNLLRLVTDQYPAYKTYGYDTSNRLIDAKQYNSGGTLTNDWTYTYDASGNRTKATATGATDLYSGYDTANELCWTKASATTISGTCASPPTGATTWTSDANGAQSGNSAGLAYAYNPKGQTTSITPAGGSAVALTHADADQVEGTSRTLSGVTTTYDNTIVGLDRSTVSGTSTYTIRDNSGVALGTHTGTTSTYYLFDGLGSVRQTIKQDGTGLATVTYDPQGQQLTGTIPANGFVGGQYDSTTKLYKFGARYDDPSLGRWTQPDPIPGQEARPESMNRYAYASNDPINKADPSGRSSCGDISFGGLVDCVSSGYSALTSPCGSAIIGIGIAVATLYIAAGTVTVPVTLVSIAGIGLGLASGFYAINSYVQAGC